MKKLAIIGASYLQEPLISKAKEMGIETYVFAWAANDVGEKIADFFYPISITEKEEILQKCQDIGIDGICTIASDLATIAVCYVAEKMGLPGNSIATSLVSTNKHEMRKCFERNGDPSPISRKVLGLSDIEEGDIVFPVIVKPMDRSGSRGITKVEKWDDLGRAIEVAKEQGFEKCALVEEYVKGKEYSVEYISQNGVHHFLAMTEKYTTGAPNFIETGHIEPAGVEETKLEEVKKIVSHALTSLGVETGASHTELKISTDGTIRIIEIGARMGGDFIGSHLVKLSTGNDFVELVVKCALGEKINVVEKTVNSIAAVKFAFNEQDCDEIETLFSRGEIDIKQYEIERKNGSEVSDSSSRWGYCLGMFETREEAIRLLNLENK